MIQYMIWGIGKRAEKQFKLLLETRFIKNIEIIGFVDNNREM